MTIQKVIRHKSFVLTVIEENCTCAIVTNRQGKQGLYYFKTGKLVFRLSNGKMASI